MARIRLVADGDDPLFDELHSGAHDKPGGIPAISRVIGHNVELLAKMRDYNNALRFSSSFDEQVIELTILAVARATGSRYVFAHHVQLAQKAGVTDEQMHALPDWRSSDAFGPRDQVVLRVAEEIRQTVGVGDAAFAEWRAHFPAESLPEYIQLVGFYLIMGALARGTELAVEPDLREHLARYWPSDP